MGDAGICCVTDVPGALNEGDGIILCVHLRAGPLEGILLVKELLTADLLLCIDSSQSS